MKPKGRKGNSNKTCPKCKNTNIQKHYQCFWCEKLLNQNWCSDCKKDGMDYYQVESVYVCSCGHIWETKGELK